MSITLQKQQNEIVKNMFTRMQSALGAKGRQILGTRRSARTVIISGFLMYSPMHEHKSPHHSIKHLWINDESKWNASCRLWYRDSFMISSASIPVYFYSYALKDNAYFAGCGSVSLVNDLKLDPDLECRLLTFNRLLVVFCHILSTTGE